jgi:hypothetical protein
MSPKRFLLSQRLTVDLFDAQVEPLNVEVNDKSLYEIKMYGDKKVMSLGNGLDPEELDYFAHVINKHLQGLHKRDENNRQDDDVYHFISGGEKGIC